MSVITPSGFKVVSQQVLKTVDVTSSILNGKNGTRICKEYAFKGEHPLLKHGVGFIRKSVTNGKFVSMEMFDTKGNFLVSGFKSIKDLISLIKGGWGIKLEGLNNPNVRADVWKHIW